MYRKEIKEAAMKYAESPFFNGRAFNLMAKRYPDGELSFWIKKRYEYIEEINKKSFLGSLWVNSDCPDLMSMENVSEFISNSLFDYYNHESYDHLSQSEKNIFIKQAIDTFFRLWFEYKIVDAIIKDFRTETKFTYLKDDASLRRIFSICQDAFDCDYSTFRSAVEGANFNLLTIKKQNVVQDLIYRLSGIMANEWYSEVCKNLNWGKKVVSGHKSKLESHSIILELDKILPRPQK